MADDFYALLEVPRDANQDEIKAAFREKVREYHPDHNDDPRANAQFTALRKAYDTLGDPVERNAYDRMGHVDYVAKRLSGLPDPETWAPSEDTDSSTASTSRTSTSTPSTGTSSTGGSARRTDSGSTSGTTSTTTGTGRSGPTRSDPGSTSTDSTSATGSNTGRRTASDGAGATARGRSVAYADDPIVDFVARHGWARRVVGWPLLYFVMAVYAAGLGAAVAAHSTAVGDLVDRISAAGTDTGALSAALEREGVPIVYDATVGGLVTRSSADPTTLAAGILVAIGALLLPTVVFLLVYLTRLSPGWKPTYLYPLAVLGPLVGLAAGAATDVPLEAELVLFGLLPFGALLVMVLSAFVRPKITAALFS